MDMPEACADRVKETTRAERKAIKQEARARTRMAYPIAAKLTPRRGLSFNVARFCSSDAQQRARSPLSGSKRP